MTFAPDIKPEEIDIVRALIEESPDPIGLYVGREMRIRIANKAIHKAWFETESVIGKTFHQVLPELEEQGFFKILDDVYTTGIAYEAKQYRIDFEVEGRTETTYWDFTYSPLKNPDGTTWGILNTAKEMTALVLEKQRADEADERQQFTLDAAEIGSWDLNLETNDVWWDERCRRYFGVNVEGNLSYADVLSLIHPADRENVRDAVARAVDPQANEAYNIQFRTVGAADGVVRWVHCKGRAFFREDGTPYRFAGIAQDITSQITADEKARSAEKFTELAIEAAGGGTYFIDLINNETIYSPSLAKILTGEDREGFTRDDFIAYVHPDDRKRREEAYKQALKTGKVILEFRTVWKDGSVHWIKTLGTYIFDPDENPVVLMGVSLDITEEVVNRDEQERLLLLIENINDFVSLSSPEGLVSYVNPAGLRMLGLKNLQEAQRPNTDYLMPEDVELLRERINPELFAKGRWSGTVSYRHFETGERIPGYGTTFMLKDKDSGRMMGRATIFHDMRPELAAQKALADSEQLFRGITTASPAALWMADKTGNITYVNQIWVDWTGRKFEEHLGDGWFNAVVDDDKGRAGQRFKKDFEARGAHENEFRIRHTDGTVHWVVCTGNPQYDDQHVFTGYIGACVDITEQKQLQQQKDEFIAIASHELKTPVTSIKAYSQVLEAMFRKEGSERQAAMVSKMGSQIDRLTNLISDLLDVTKIQSGRLQFNETYFDLNTLVHELVEDVQRTTVKHKINIEATQLPDICADRERIGQVIINLLTNAIKYSPDRDEIIIRTQMKEDTVQVSVTDFGIGINAAKRDRVFEQFYRVTGHKQHTFPGLGLGLYISAEIVKRAGGSIWVESEENKGSTFYFTLPISVKQTI